MSDTITRYEELFKTEADIKDVEVVYENVKPNNRKKYPMYLGLLKYFPNALREVSHCSYMGQQQHNPDKPLAWDRTKSQDDLDAMLRHLTDHANGIEIDDDGVYHLVKCCWRILGATEKLLENKYEQK